MRKRKRRTHYKAAVPNILTCKTTGEAHLRHQAYMHEGDLYYKGQVVIKGDVEETEE
jgi:large subunit ribosomal protein L32